MEAAEVLKLKPVKEGFCTPLLPMSILFGSAGFPNTKDSPGADPSPAFLLGKACPFMVTELAASVV